jgi:hypothetical protein
LDSEQIPIINNRKNSKILKTGKIGNIAAASKLGLLNQNQNQKKDESNKDTDVNFLKKEIENKEREKQMDLHRELGEKIKNLTKDKDKEKENIIKSNQHQIHINQHKIEIGNNHISSSNTHDKFHNSYLPSSTKQIIQNSQVHAQNNHIKSDVKKDIIKFKDSSNSKDINNMTKEPVKDLHQLHNIYNNITSNINKTKEVIKKNNLAYKDMIKENYNFDTSKKDQQNLDANKQSSSKEKIDIGSSKPMPKPKAEIKCNLAKVGEIKANVHYNKPSTSNSTSNNNILKKQQPSNVLLSNLNQNKNKPLVSNQIKQEIKKMPYTKHVQPVVNQPGINSNEMKINLNSDKHYRRDKENIGMKYIHQNVGNKKGLPVNSKINSISSNTNKINEKNWGLGIGDWGLGPIPNPQSPIPNKIYWNILKI